MICILTRLVADDQRVLNKAGKLWITTVLCPLGVSATLHISCKSFEHDFRCALYPPACKFRRWTHHLMLFFVRATVSRENLCAEQWDVWARSGTPAAHLHRDAVEVYMAPHAYTSQQASSWQLASEVRSGAEVVADCAHELLNISGIHSALCFAYDELVRLFV
jgi:hypothetical protein